MAVTKSMKELCRQEAIIVFIFTASCQHLYTNAIPTPILDVSDSVETTKGLDNYNRPQNSIDKLKDESLSNVIYSNGSEMLPSHDKGDSNQQVISPNTPFPNSAESVNGNIVSSSGRRQEMRGEGAQNNGQTMPLLTRKRMQAPILRRRRSEGKVIGSTEHLGARVWSRRRRSMESTPERNEYDSGSDNLNSHLSSASGESDTSGFDPAAVQEEIRYLLELHAQDQAGFEPNSLDDQSEYPPQKGGFQGRDDFSQTLNTPYGLNIGSILPKSKRDVFYHKRQALSPDFLSLQQQQQQQSSPLRRTQRSRARYRGDGLRTNMGQVCNYRRVTVEMLMEYFTTGKMCGSNVVRMRFGLG